MWLLYMGLGLWEAVHVASVHGVKLVTTPFVSDAVQLLIMCHPCRCVSLSEIAMYLVSAVVSLLS